MTRDFEELFPKKGTKLKMSSAYHPETDGQKKVLNPGMTPFKGVYGRKLSALEQHLPGKFVVESVADEFLNLEGAEV
ncbi:hypothetical protein V2J09_000797 [Rumex salicifolius]